MWTGPLPPASLWDCVSGGSRRGGVGWPVGGRGNKLGVFASQYQRQHQPRPKQWIDDPSGKSCFHDAEGGRVSRNSVRFPAFSPVEHDVACRAPGQAVGAAVARVVDHGLNWPMACHRPRLDPNLGVSWLEAVCRFACRFFVLGFFLPSISGAKQ